MIHPIFLSKLPSPFEQVHLSHPNLLALTFNPLCDVFAHLMLKEFREPPIKAPIDFFSKIRWPPCADQSNSLNWMELSIMQPPIALCAASQYI